MGLRTGGRAAVLAAAVAVIFGGMSAASAETLLDALSSAYNSNPDLLAQRSVLRQTDETVAQALSNWRPTVTLQGQWGKEYVKNSNLSRSEWLTPRQAVASVTQPIFRGGRTIADTRAADQDVLAQRAALMATEQSVLLSAITAYFNVLRDAATVDLQRNNVNVLQQQLDATNARFKVGELTRTDVAQAEARLAGARSDLTASEANLAITRANYQRIVGTAPGTLAVPNFVGAIPATEEETQVLAGDQNPHVRTAVYREQAARYRVDSAIGVLLPTVQVIGQAARAYDSTTKGDKTDDFSILGQVTVPLYQGGAEYAGVRQAKQLVGQRMVELDAARRTAIESATQAWRTLASARAQIQSINSQIQANEVALEGVKQEAQVGSRTVLDVLDQEQELLNSRVQLVRARRDEAVAFYQVQAAIGQLTARSLSLPVEYYDEEEYYRENSGKWIGLGD